jgi:hypothetical protein
MTRRARWRVGHLAAWRLQRAVGRTDAWTGEVLIEAAHHPTGLSPGRSAPLFSRRA